MPCTCDGYPDTDGEHMGEAAELLCEIMYKHESEGELISGCFTTKQLQWWEEHKKRDLERINEELEGLTPAKRKKIERKLSEYELKLLYLGPTFGLTPK